MRRAVVAIAAVMVVLGAALVPAPPPADAALVGSIPFTVSEFWAVNSASYQGGRSFETVCEYRVVAIFDAEYAFMLDTPDGPRQHIMVSRPGLAEPTPMKVSDRYGGASSIYTDWGVPAVILPPGKLAYVWYSASGYDPFGGFQDPDQSGCIAIGNLRASGQSPANANSRLGLYPNERLAVTVTSDSGNQTVGEDVNVTMTVNNPFDEPVTSFELLGPQNGLSFNTEYLQLVSGPSPAPTTVLAPGTTVTFSYVLRPLQSGNIQVRAAATGIRAGSTVSSEGVTLVRVPPLLDLSLASSVTSATKAGDEFEVVATLTNREDVELTDIRAEPLAQRPGGKLTTISGPTDSAGNDPRTVPLRIPAGESATIRWVYRAEERGSVELTAQISGRDPRLGSVYFLSESLTVAIEAPALEISDLRLQPGSIVPGDFGVLRGTLTNVGSTTVTGIDFTLEGTPDLEPVELPSNHPDSSMSPKIATLAEGASREFLIPVAMVTDAGGLATYRATLTMTGAADVGGVATDVTATADTVNALDLSPYWSTIFDEVKRNLFQDFLDFVEGTNEWGDTSTLGGVAVGSTEGALKAFQKMGDGLLATGDLVVDTVSGGSRLTDQGTAIVAAAREYLHTTSAQKMVVDLAELERNIPIGGARVLAEWLRDIDRAAEAGDARKVASLIAEPATAIGIGITAEVAGGQLFAKLAAKPLVRDTMAALKRAPEPIVDGPDVPYDQIVRRESQDLKDIPTGVPVTGQTVARAGLTPDEHGWMIDMAREHGVAFFVRPRPEAAAKWAKLGYNAKPMAIKLKSISTIDHKWLGWDDFADAEGLVVFRKPKDPLEAMKAAVKRGELEWGGPEVDEIIERYNLRLAEWKSYEQPFGPNGPTVDPQQGLLHKLNGDTLGPDGAITPGDGFDVQRYGNTKRTKVTIDPDGVVKFTYNNKPVFSDIDLLHIARPDGTPIPKALHELISEKAGFGIDGQHGDSVATSDFPNWETAKKFAVQYANEHKRGGDPLVVVQGDVTTLGYVDTIEVPTGDILGSGYDLYSRITTTYEGAGRR